MRQHLFAVTILVGGLLPASSAIAAEQDEGDLVVPQGMSFTIGGSFADYVREDARDTTMPGVGWEARYVFGTRSHLAGEAAYTAGVNGLDTLGVDENALLMSNGAEASLRANVLTEAIQPYVVAGVGWKHYQVVNTDTNTSDVADTDDALTVPVSVGVAYRYERVMADVRGMYRASFLDDFAPEGETGLDAYSVGLNFGFEF